MDKRTKARFKFFTIMGVVLGVLVGELYQFPVLLFSVSGIIIGTAMFGYFAGSKGEDKH